MSGDNNMIFSIWKAVIVTTWIALLTLGVIGQSSDMTRLLDATQQLSASLEALDWAKSETLCLEIIELKSRIYGANSIQSGRSLIDLGRVQRQEGKFTEARQNLERAVAIIEHFGDSAAADLVTGYSAIGYDYFYNQKLKDAEAYYLKALNIADRVFGPKSMESYLPAINLANLYLGELKYEKANEFYIRSYRSAMTHFKSDAKEVSMYWNSGGALT
jgi:tetratricopeptide (TPR) repeat protein